MTDPVVLKVTGTKENGTYSVKDKLGRDLFSISVKEEEKRGVIYKKGIPPIELIIV